jgi:hypothetical protein
MLQNVAGHNVRVLKRKRHITYSVTKGIPLQNVLKRLRNVYLMFCDAVRFVTLYVMRSSRFDTLTYRILTLCTATLSNIHVL